LKPQFFIASEAAGRGLLRGWWGEEGRKRMAVQAADGSFERFKSADVGEVGVG
jgi:hypothetical protein